MATSSSTRPPRPDRTPARPFQNNPFVGSKFYQRWYRHVAQPPSNDFVVAITASSRSSVSRTGKTTLGVTAAKALDASDSGFDASEKATMREDELGYDIVPNVEQQSAVIYDEAQGTPEGTGLNKRRGMKSDTINAINAVLANGDKQLTLVIIGQQLSMLDTLLYPLIDAWILIRKGPSQPDGPLATHHSLYVNDYDLKNPKIKTPAHEDLTWSALPSDDPDYAAMEEMKQDAKQKSGDDDEDAEQERTKVTQTARDRLIRDRYDDGIDQKTLAEAWGIQQSRVSQIVNGE